MTNHALLFTLAAIGMAETNYLIKTRQAAKRPVCVIGDSCHAVLESQYNSTFGIQNDLWGILFYCAVAILTAFLNISPTYQNYWDGLVRALIYLASIFTLYLLYLQWRVIKVWCFWCLMSAITVYLMLVIVLFSKLTT